MIKDSEIEEIVLQSVRQANLARAADEQLDVSPDAPLFGPDSRLDSLGLVALIIDIEEALQERGSDFILSDERAMSQTRSPFRDVPTLVRYIAALQDGRP